MSKITSLCHLLCTTGSVPLCICNTRHGRGRNDSIYERLPQKFNISRAPQKRDDDPTGNRTRSMIKNWTRQGLVRNTAVGEYEKLV